MPVEDDERTDQVPPKPGDPTRLLALTDGVFAIIMTLLVLELQIPLLTDASRLGQLLILRTPTLVAYIISFLLAGVYWVGHRELFSLVRRLSPLVQWLNIIFLMIASLIPFAAELLGSYPTVPLALGIYGVLLTILAGWRLLLYRYITGRPELLFAPVPPVVRLRVSLVMSLAVASFFTCVMVAGFVPPALVFLVYLVTPTVFVASMIRAARMPVQP